jgi:hypothetical protein
LHIQWPQFKGIPEQTTRLVGDENATGLGPRLQARR